MEIYQAANKFQDDLVNVISVSGAKYDYVWRVRESSRYNVKTDKDELFYTITYVPPINIRIKCPTMDDDKAIWEEYYNETMITKQRGGIRLFRTLDAVKAALKQIGQYKLVLEFEDSRS